VALIALPGSLAEQIFDALVEKHLAEFEVAMHRISSSLHAGSVGTVPRT